MIREGGSQLDKKIITIFAVFFLCFLHSGYLLAADYLIGFVNLPQVLEAAPQSQAAQTKLQKEFATRDRDLVAAQNKLKDLEDRLTKDGAIMSEDERQRLERDIINGRRDLKRDTQEFQEDVNFRRNEEMNEIQKIIAEAIIDFGKEESYDLVITNGVVFASEKIDVTDQIIELLKKR